MSANIKWRALLSHLLQGGDEVSPRGKTTKERLCHTTRWDMSSPVITCPIRKLGYRFMVGEAAWILSGDNRVSSIAPHARQISQFSDDGLTFFGAYGPPFVDQEGYIVHALSKDPSTRQAVMTLWRSKPMDTKDVPCTVALQWIARNGFLHCVATMRSSDAWLGIPYDIFNFSMMSAHVLLSLRHAERRQHRLTPEAPRPWADTQLGGLMLTAGSQHLYKIDWEAAAAAAACREDLFIVQPPNINEFDHPDELPCHLKRLLGGPAENAKHRWLAELPIHAAKKES